MSRKRKLLADEVSTHVKQAFAGKRNVAFEQRANSTVIKLGTYTSKLDDGRRS